MIEPESICSKFNRCKQFKTCPHCSKSRRNRIGYQINGRTQDGANYLSMTFTVPEGGERYREAVMSIMVAFKRLKRLQVWKPITGGVVWVEANRSGGVHLHVMARTSGDIDLKAIERHWHRLTGSFNISIRPIESPEHHRNLAYYVKPTDNLDFEGKRIFAKQTKRMRLVQLFGDFRNDGPMFPRNRPPQPLATVAEQLDTNQNNFPAELEIELNKTTKDASPDRPDYLYIYRLTSEQTEEPNYYIYLDNNPQNLASSQSNIPKDQPIYQDSLQLDDSVTKWSDGSRRLRKAIMSKTRQNAIERYFSKPD